MAIFSATFSAISVSAAQDLFEIVASANKRITILEIEVGQYTDFGDAAGELLPLQIIRGYTTAGSGGTSVTPNAFVASSRYPTVSPEATVTRNNTTIASNGSPQTLIAATWNIQGGGWWKNREIEVDHSERLVVRLPTAPADALTMNATLIFEEK